MTALAKPLPKDAETLTAMLIAERAAHAAALAAHTDEAERLRQIIKALQRHRFGRRAETLPIDQLELALEDVEQGEAEADTRVETTAPERKAERAKTRRTNRGSPASAHPPDGSRPWWMSRTRPVRCCRGAPSQDRRGRSERLDVIPAQFRVLITRRPKYACRACEEGVVQAPAPARLIEGGLPSEALVAHVLTAKYADHCPLYRQAQIYARQGVELDRSTLADWVGRAAFLLRPVHERLLENLKASAKLFADETTLPVLDPGRGRTKTGQLWAYARDDRPWGGRDPPAAVYVYATDRTAGQPIKHLAGFKGVLQVDGYGGYRPLAEKGEVKLAFCWAHVRRPFYELAAAGPAPIASEMLERIKALYAIEADIRERAAEDRAAARKVRTSPILMAMEAWLRGALPTISQKGKLAEAIRYTLARWEGLTRFADDGTIEIDSNTVERSIRPIALTRKNALFAGSDGGAEHWAVVASLIETCKLNAIDPEAYLGQTITRIVQGHPQSRVGELLPWAYAA